MNRRQLISVTVVWPLLLGGATAIAEGPAAAFVNPKSWGPVDFGDTVQFALAGAGCATDSVAVVIGGAARRAVRGRAVRPLPDPLHPGSCVGLVTVPSERQVRATGWDAGDPLHVVLASRTARLPLQYQRLEVEAGHSSAGTPALGRPPVRDPRGGARDRAVRMNTGDVWSLGRVDLSHVHSVSVRVCMDLPKPHLSPTFIELRASGPDGPTVVGPVDVNDDPLNSYKSNFGWPNCWQLQTWPVTGEVPGRAPELYLAVPAAAGGPVYVSFVDVNGTGARVPDLGGPQPAPSRSIFDGTSFRGWQQTGCLLDERAARPVHTRDLQNYAAIATAGFVSEAGCVMTYTAKKLHNVRLSLDYRMQDFGDNGGIFVGGHEIQLREAGEWLTGGFLGSTVPAALTEFATDNAGGYPAQRIKSSTYPDWSRMEILQLGSRYLVRINGRTVTDCRDCAGDPGPFHLRLETQPGFSYRYGINGRFDNPYYPDITKSSDWGNVWFRDVRVYQCQGTRDPACTSLPGVRG